jgi:hypothetical protein
MKAITATTRDYATKCDTKPDWWTKERGGFIKRGAFDIFDQHNTWVIMHDRSAHSDLSLLEIALAPEIRKIIKYLSSCLHLASWSGRSPCGRRL